MGASDLEPPLPLGAMPMTGTVVGYDPGGNCKHGLARATVRDGDIVCVTTKTLRTVADVFASIRDIKTPLGIGIDTLTCWSTGHSGLRPADCWLRQRYPDVKKSVQAPNSIYGAMSVSGMALLVALRREFPDIFVTETHPKVLYYALFKEHYDYTVPNTSVMDKCLSRLLNVDIAPQNEHEWDAAISILPVVRRLHESWELDLHALSTNSDERLVQPCGTTNYVWPGRYAPGGAHGGDRRVYCGAATVGNARRQRNPAAVRISPVPAGARQVIPRRFRISVNRCFTTTSANGYRLSAKTGPKWRTNISPPAPRSPERPGQTCTAPGFLDKWAA